MVYQRMIVMLISLMPVLKQHALIIIHLAQLAIRALKKVNVKQNGLIYLKKQNKELNKSSNEMNKRWVMHGTKWVEQYNKNM